MKYLKNILGGLFTLLIVVGVVKGLVMYGQTAQQGATLKDAALLVVQGVADMTVFLIPTLIDFGRSILGR